MWAFTYRHLHFLYSLKNQTKAYLCTVLGNLPSSTLGPFLTCTGNFTVQLLSITRPTSQQPACVTPQAHARPPRAASTFKYTQPAPCSGLHCLSSFVPELHLSFFPFVLCFADVFGNLKVRKRLDLKPSSPDALYALARFSPNWIKAIMWVREELYKHCFNRCSYSSVGQWKNFSW